MSCVANTHSLYIEVEHNLFQTRSGREEAHEHLQTDQLTKINLISISMHDHKQNLCVAQLGNLGLFGKTIGI